MESQKVGQPEQSDTLEHAAPGREEANSGDLSGGHDAEVSRSEFNSLEPDTGAEGRQDVDLDLVLDIPVTMAMEVGRARLSIRNLLQLGRGSVVELDRLAGEPMDVKVNGVLVGHGEVVVVNEKFGIRLTSVVRPAEWIQKLK